MLRLIWVFAWCTDILLVLSWGGSNVALKLASGNAFSWITFEKYFPASFKQWICCKMCSKVMPKINLIILNRGFAWVGEIKFEFWQSCWLDSEVLTSGKCYMTNDVDFKQFWSNIQTFKLLQKKWHPFVLFFHIKNIFAQNFRIEQNRILFTAQLYPLRVKGKQIHI